MAQERQRTRERHGSDGRAAGSAEAAGGTPSPETILAEIKRLYFNTTKATIEKDLARAVALLKAMPSEDQRERAAVYMDGLSQMRSEWANGSRTARKPR